jgi:capsular polysaccharide biosynthesis protein
MDGTHSWCGSQGEEIMRNLVIGFILGVVVTTVGFSGIARMLDKGVQTIQTQSKELAQ